MIETLSRLKEEYKKRRSEDNLREAFAQVRESTPRPTKTVYLIYRSLGCCGGNDKPIDLFIERVVPESSTLKDGDIVYEPEENDVLI